MWQLWQASDDSFVLGILRRSNIHLCKTVINNASQHLSKDLQLISLTRGLDTTWSGRLISLMTKSRDVLILNPNPEAPDHHTSRLQQKNTVAIDSITPRPYCTDRKACLTQESEDWPTLLHFSYFCRQGWDAELWRASELPALSYFSLTSAFQGFVNLEDCRTRPNEVLTRVTTLGQDRTGQILGSWLFG